MSIATQDATSRASTQVSLAEFHDAFACDEEPSESTESDSETCDPVQREDTRDDLDYSQSVIISKHGSHYHAIQYGSICACPHVHGETTTLGEAVKSGKLPCSVCGPVDYRRERPIQSAGKT